MNEQDNTTLTEDLPLSEPIAEENKASASDTVPAVEPEEAEEPEEVTAEEISPADGDAEESIPTVSREELCTEIERLRAELDQTKALHARMANELSEFHALFPEVNTACIPESIWEQVKNGIPLAASYALYEKKCNLRRLHAEEINLHNAKHTPGAAGKNTPAEYFSPDEVRHMSPSEVRSNYQKILDSMKKWNR